MVQKFMVEKFKVEKSGVKAWGWNVHSWDVFEPSLLAQLATSDVTEHLLGLILTSTFLKKQFCLPAPKSYICYMETLNCKHTKVYVYCLYYFPTKSEHLLRAFSNTLLIWLTYILIIGGTKAYHGGFHLHLMLFPFVYQFNSRIGVLVHSSFAND